MKTYKIIYQKGNDICFTHMKVEDDVNVLYAFYMTYGYGVDVIEVSEVSDEA